MGAALDSARDNAPLSAISPERREDSPMFLATSQTKSLILLAMRWMTTILNWLHTRAEMRIKIKLEIIIPLLLLLLKQSFKLPPARVTTRAWLTAPLLLTILLLWTPQTPCGTSISCTTTSTTQCKLHKASNTNNLNNTPTTMDLIQRYTP